MRMGGKPAPFGVDEERLQDVVAHILAEPALALRGIHLFVGTQILDHAVLLAQYRHGARHRAPRRRLASAGRWRRSISAAGSAFPTSPTRRSSTWTRFGRDVRTLLDEVSGDAGVRGTRFVLEPGRYLVAEAGIYVARVMDIKKSRGKTFVVLDGGMNHHLAASGNLGQVIKRNFPIAVLNQARPRRERDRRRRRARSARRSTCSAATSGSPRCEEGDLVGIFQSGAYALSASPLEFLSRPSPAEVLVAGGAHASSDHGVSRMGQTSSGRNPWFCAACCRITTTATS